MDLSPRKQTAKGKQPKVARGVLHGLALLSRRRKRQIGTAAINLVLYAILVVAYFFVVLKWLNEPLARLCRENLTHYAAVSVMLILGQGLLLDIVTSNLLRLAKWVNGKWRE